MSCYNVLGTFEFLKELGLNGEDIDPEIWIRCIRRFFDQYKDLSFHTMLSRLQIRFYPGFWDVNNHRIFYILWLFTKLNYTTMEDVYSLRIDDFKQNEGYTLIQKYHSSIWCFVRSIYPVYEWVPWKFHKTEGNFWNDTYNVKWYMQWLYSCLNFKSMNDWYSICGKTLETNYGGGIIKKYNGSVSTILSNIYPDYEWFPWKFVSVPTGYWKEKTNIRIYLDWLQKELKFKSIEDWYKVTEEHFKLNYGDGLLTSTYNCKVKDLLEDIYPEYEWLPWKFKLAPHRFWNDIDNQKWYISWLYKQLKYSSIEDWYKVSVKDFEDNYGRTLIRIKYNSSPFNLLSSLIEYDWIGWKMRQAPSGFWDKIENRQKYLVWLTKLLKYNSYSDWYKLSIRLFCQNYGCGLLDKYSNSIYKLLVTTYPTIKWIKNKFNGTSYSKVSIEWLSDIEKERGITIQHAQNTGEFKIPNSQYRADGYHKESNTIFEYNGCFVHGCLSCFPDREQICSLTKRTYQEEYDYTIKRKQFIIDQGFNYEEIWNCEYIKRKK